jgi:hypothetical protein
MINNKKDMASSGLLPTIKSKVILFLLFSYLLQKMFSLKQNNLIHLQSPPCGCFQCMHYCF